MSGWGDVHHSCPVHGFVEVMPSCTDGVTRVLHCTADDPDRPHGICDRPCGPPIRIAATGEVIGPGDLDAEDPFIKVGADGRRRRHLQIKKVEEEKVEATCDQCERTFEKRKTAKRCPECIEAVSTFKWSDWKREYGIPGARRKARGEDPPRIRRAKRRKKRASGPEKPTGTGGDSPTAAVPESVSVGQPSHEGGPEDPPASGERPAKDVPTLGIPSGERPATPQERSENGSGTVPEPSLLDRVAVVEAKLDAHLSCLSPDRNVESVVTRLRERSKVGLAKYGTTTEREDLDVVAWLRHLQEELLDAAVYVEALIARKDAE